MTYFDRSIQAAEKQPHILCYDNTGKKLGTLKKPNWIFYPKFEGGKIVAFDLNNGQITKLEDLEFDKASKKIAITPRDFLIIKHTLTIIDIISECDRLAENKKRILGNIQVSKTLKLPLEISLDNTQDEIFEKNKTFTISPKYFKGKNNTQAIIVSFLGDFYEEVQNSFDRLKEQIKKSELSYGDYISDNFPTIKEFFLQLNRTGLSDVFIRTINDEVKEIQENQDRQKIKFLLSELYKNGERLTNHEYVCFSNGTYWLLSDFPITDVIEKDENEKIFSMALSNKNFQDRVNEYLYTFFLNHFEEFIEQLVHIHKSTQWWNRNREYNIEFLMNKKDEEKIEFIKESIQKFKLSVRQTHNIFKSIKQNKHIHGERK